MARKNKKKVKPRHSQSPAENASTKSQETHSNPKPANQDSVVPSRHGIHLPRWLVITGVALIIVAILGVILPPAPNADLQSVSSTDSLKQIPKLQNSSVDLFAGFEKASVPLGNLEGFKPGQVVAYPVPNDLIPGRIYVVGDWFNHPQALIHAGKAKGVITTIFQGEDIYLLASSNSTPADLTIFLDKGMAEPGLMGLDAKEISGRPTLTVKEPKYYHVLKNVPPGPHLLTLIFEGNDLEFAGISYS